MPLDPAKRFSARVEEYVKHRPSYPPELLELLRAEVGLRPDHVVADIGSGTGIMSILLLEHGNTVHCVEPNAAMSVAAATRLAKYSGYLPIEGRAEATGLPDASVDHVVAGQSFHWFVVDDARWELARILRPGGSAVVVWNSRRTTGTPFREGYEELLMRYGTDYARVRRRYGDTESLDGFFGAGRYSYRCFDNVQRFDFAGLRGRLESSSYAPTKGEPAHEALVAELHELFERTAEDGVIRFEYATEVYFGPLAAE